MGILEESLNQATPRRPSSVSPSLLFLPWQVPASPVTNVFPSQERSPPTWLRRSLLLIRLLSSFPPSTQPTWIPTRSVANLVSVDSSLDWDLRLPAETALMGQWCCQPSCRQKGSQGND